MENKSGKSWRQLHEGSCKGALWRVVEEVECEAARWRDAEENRLWGAQDARGARETRAQRTALQDALCGRSEAPSSRV